MQVDKGAAQETWEVKDATIQMAGEYEDYAAGKVKQPRHFVSSYLDPDGTTYKKKGFEDVAVSERRRTSYIKYQL